MHSFGKPEQAALIAASSNFSTQTYYQDPNTGMPGATPFSSGQAATQTSTFRTRSSPRRMPLLPTT